MLDSMKTWCPVKVSFEESRWIIDCSSSSGWLQLVIDQWKPHGVVNWWVYLRNLPNLSPKHTWDVWSKSVIVGVVSSHGQWALPFALRIRAMSGDLKWFTCLPDHPFPQCWMCMMYKHTNQHLFSNILYKLWQPTLTKKWLKGWSLVDINIAHSWSTTWPWLQALQEWPPFDPDNGEVWDKESRGWNLWTNGLKLNTVYLCGFNELLHNCLLVNPEMEGIFQH